MDTPQLDVGEVTRLLQAAHAGEPAANKLDTADANQRIWYLNAVSGLGLALVAQGRAAEARPLLESAVELSRRNLGETHLRTADARLSLGRALLATGHYDEAEPLLLAASAVFEKQRRSQPYFAAQTEAALAQLRARRGH